MLMGFLGGQVGQRLLLSLILLSSVLLNASAKAKSLFAVPPTQVSIHNPEATEGVRNRTTISVVVPVDSGHALKTIVLRQLPSLDQWDWGQSEPQVYFGNYSLRGRGKRGLASALITESGGMLEIQLTQAAQPGQTVNVVFRGFNPASGIYQWSTELIPDGVDPVRYVGPSLRLNVYEQDPFR